MNAVLIVDDGARVGLTVEAAADLPDAEGDAERLRQVPLKLTGNPIEAMQDAGGRLTLRARSGGTMVAHAGGNCTRDANRLDVQLTKARPCRTPAAPDSATERKVMRFGSARSTAAA